MGVKVVAVSGPSGGGKSTIVKAISDRLSNVCRVHFDDYDPIYPKDIVHWVENGCNPDVFSTPKMIADIKDLREQQESYKLIIVEEPFGRNRTAMSELIDYVVCINIPLEIALARRLKRTIASVSKSDDASHKLKNIDTFLDDYIACGRDVYAMVNRNVMMNCDLVIDGTRTVEVLTDEVVQFLRGKLECRSTNGSSGDCTAPS